MTSPLRTIFPPDPNPRKPRVSLPSGTCDTHFHVFGPPDLFPYAEQRGYNPSMSPIEHYLDVAKALGIQRGVVVHPIRVYGPDYRVTLNALDVARAAEFPLRAIVTMASSDPPLSKTDYETMHRRGVRGVRLNCARMSFGSFDGNLLQRAVEAISFQNWAVELQIDADYIAANVDLFKRIDIPVIFDMLAHLKSASDPSFDAVAELLGRRNFWIKCAAVERFVSLMGVAHSDLVELTQALIAHAPDRMIWGTDWPHTQRYGPGMMPNDGDLVDMMLDLVPDGPTRTKIFVANPAALFDLDG